MIKVYTKNNCVQCTQTKRLLTQLEIQFEEINIENDPKMIDEFKQKGFLAMPIVVTDRGSWSGFKYERIQGLPHKKDNK